MYDFAAAARIDFQLGYFIRKTYCGWNQLPLSARRYYVDRFRALRDELIAITGNSSISITLPWTERELYDSAEIGGNLADRSPLETAVAVTERILRKCGRLPETLDSRVYPFGPLDPVPHGKNIAMLESMHAMRKPPIRRKEPRVSESSRIKGWIRYAERKIQAD